MSEPNTPHDPSSTPLWSLEEPGDAPGADAAGLPSDATQPWDPSEIETAAATSAGTDAGLSADAAAAAASGATEPWASGPTSEPPAAVPTTLDSAGVALGVASGRPRPPEEPPIGGKTPPTAIVGGVIGLAVVVALAAWFLLLRPTDNTAVASPSPAPTVLVSPSPTATATDEPTAEPTDESTPEPTPFQAPTFTGRSLDEAQDLASSGGLQLDITYDTTTNEPDGTVLSQVPEPGTEVLPGDQIFLVVAQPGPTVLVPDVVGVPVEDALNLLIDSDLRPGERTEAVDAEVAAGEVISTDPAAGEVIDRGSSVDYVVSVGPEATAEPTPAPVAVPDLRGVPAEDALNQLLDAGLEPGERTDAFDEGVPSGSVVSTDPEAGTEVAPGTTVAYVVSLGVEPTPTAEPTPAPVAVPDLRGVPAEDALNQLLDAGLEPGERTDAFDEGVPSGSVVSTDPEAGTEVAPGTTVAYVVSLGVEPTPTAEPTPAPVAVPDLRGVPAEDALNQLLDAGLEPGERTDAFDEGVPSGSVVSTDPEAGTEVAPGTTVAYVVSLGVEPTPTAEPTPAPVAVPDLRGLPAEDAVNALIDAGLEPGRRSDAFDAEVPLGAIISTDPAAGEELEPGSRVDYVVSQGVEPTAVPDLRAVAAEDAVNALIDAGLEPGERTDAFDDEVAAGAVVSTDPEAGTEVAPGTTVDYVVSLGVEPTPTPEPTPAPIAVPDLRGQPAEDAVNALIDAGLEPGRRTDAFDAEVALGSIISTDPAAGVELDPGSRVDYLVSKGIEPVVVPDLRGVPAEDALNQLLDAGLQPGERSDAFDDEVAAGAVVSTTPEAGTEVAPGTTVDYVVSLGVEPVVVPDLRGVPADDALDRLNDAGLEPGDRSDAFDGEVATGSLIGTDPGAGVQVAPGTSVDYVVSRGVQPVAVPDVRGFAAEDAVNALIDAGLEPGERSDAFDDEVAAGAVIGTDPEAGTEVAPGTAVAYVVSQGAEPTPTPEPTPAPVAVPDVRGFAEADAQNTLIDAGLQPGERSDAFDDEVAAGAVIGTDPEAGTEVAPGTAVAYVVSQGAEPTPTPEPTPAPVAVPDVRGFAEADAQNTLIDAGLQPGERSDAFDDEVAAGAVIGTDPEAGTEVAPGTAVAYVVSQGPEPTPTPEPTPAPVAVPDVRGLTADDAVNALIDAGLEPGDRTDAFDAEVAAGVVVSTDPTAGVQVQPATTIDYLVSSGPEPTPTPEPTPAPVAVPDVRGFAEADAQNTLIDAGLQPGERSDAFDDEVAAGAVIGTDPGAGTEVAPGTAVAYVVSSGPEPTPTPEPTPAPVAVPDVRGFAEADAQNTLIDAGLQPGERSDAFDDEVAAGAVIGTDPGAGTEVAPGTAVAYVVSSGPEPTPTPVAVPDVRGFTADDAVNALLDARLEPGERRDRFNENVPEGQVIRTDPSAGTEVAPGTPVELFVSRGAEPTPTPEPTPATAVVPDVRGFAEADAQNTLIDAGLQPGERSDAFHDDVAEGAVISTNPAAGTEVERGSTVDYLVSRGPEPTPTPTAEPTPAPVAVPDVRGFTAEDAVNAILEVGLQPGERSDKFNGQVPEGQVIRTDPESGTEVEPGSIVNLVVSRGPNATPTPEPTPAAVAIPDLRGVPAEDALNQLIEAGLQPGERQERFNDSVPEGQVIRTDPAAGTEIPPGTAVDYFVSLGVEPTPTPEPTPELVTVPNLRGEDPDDAVNVLLEAGLQPGERQDRFNDNVPEGQVIRTDPEAGSEVAPGTTVDYRVSRGPEPTPEPTAAPTPESPDLVTIPNLRGIGVDDAVNSLIDLGLEPGRRIDRVNGAVPVGQVIRTAPEAGTEVEAGTSVDYYVSREADATAEPTQEPTAEPTDSGTGQGAQAAVDEVAGQLPAIRELEPRKEVPYREITQRQFRRMVAASFDEDNPAARVAAEETLLKRLGLLPEDADLRELMLDMYESQVAAFYDPDTGDMTVIQRDGDFGPEDRLFVAHEYDHALQDQYWDLNKVTDVSASQGDRALARLALIEGDATTAMLQWATQNLSQEQLAEVGSSLTPADQELLARMPAILRRQLEFPYLDGQVFVSTLMGQGGWDVVNQAWDRLPASTEQILHPERYPDDAPIKLEMPDVAAALGQGWDQRYVQTLGELDISVLLGDDGAAAADGWGGDRLLSLEGPDGSWAVVWQTAWDSGSDADEFSAVADSTLAGLEGAQAVLPGANIAGDVEAPVLVLLASSGDTLQQVEEALGVAQ